MVEASYKIAFVLTILLISNLTYQKLVRHKISEKYSKKIVVPVIALIYYLIYFMFIRTLY